MKTQKSLTVFSVPLPPKPHMQRTSKPLANGGKSEVIKSRQLVPVKKTARNEETTPGDTGKQERQKSEASGVSAQNVSVVAGNSSIACGNVVESVITLGGNIEIGAIFGGVINFYSGGASSHQPHDLPAPIAEGK
jgi:hypothetical protein